MTEAPFSLVALGESKLQSKLLHLRHLEGGGHGGGRHGGGHHEYFILYTPWNGSLNFHFHYGLPWQLCLTKKGLV